MATWSDISRESLKAAGITMRNECYRSSVSRAYYAAYAAIAGALSEKGMEFSGDRLGPSHAQVSTLVSENMGQLSSKQRRHVIVKMHVLYQSRLDADYRPNRSVDQSTARNSLIHATFILSMMGVIA